MVGGVKRETLTFAEIAEAMGIPVEKGQCKECGGCGRMTGAHGYKRACSTCSDGRTITPCWWANCKEHK